MPCARVTKKYEELEENERVTMLNIDAKGVVTIVVKTRDIYGNVQSEATRKITRKTGSYTSNHSTDTEIQRRSSRF